MDQGNSTKINWQYNIISGETLEDWLAEAYPVSTITELQTQLGRFLGWLPTKKSIERKAASKGLRKAVHSGVIYASEDKHIHPLIHDLQNPDVDLDIWLNKLDELRTLSDKADPILTSVNIDIDSREPIAIQFVSDIHLGSRYVAYDEFRQLLEKTLRTPGVYWAMHGDDIEGFLPSFRSAEAVFGQLISPERQLQIFVKILSKLADSGKLLYGCSGQHSGKWFDQAIGFNPVKLEYTRRSIPYFEGQGIVRIRLGDITYNLAVSHSFPGSSIYNPNHAQRRASLVNFPNADIIVMGDRHRPSIQKISDKIIEFDAGMRQTPWTWLIQTGTVKTGNDKYAIQNWSRGLLDWPAIVIHPDEHRIRLVESIDDIEYFLGRKK